MENISNYENAALMYFEGVELAEQYAYDARMSEALSACFHEAEINGDQLYGSKDSSEYKGLAHSALDLAQTLADNANDRFLDGEFENVTVEKSEGLRVAIYGDGTKLAETRVRTDLRENDPEAIMANGDKIGNLADYDWDDIEKLEETQMSMAQEDDFAAAVENISGIGGPAM